MPDAAVAGRHRARAEGAQRQVQDRRRQAAARPNCSPRTPTRSAAGAANLRKQIENIKVHGVSPVVAINAFPSDYRFRAPGHPRDRRVGRRTGRGEHPLLRRWQGCHRAGRGGRSRRATSRATFTLLLPRRGHLREKIETVATKIYGAASVTYTAAANTQLDRYEKNGFGNLPVCIAKTHLSTQR